MTNKFTSTTKHIQHLYSLGVSVDEIISIISIEWEVSIFKASIYVEYEIKELD